MRIVTDKLVKYAALRKTRSHWCLIPIIVKATPVPMRMTPAMPTAGVMEGFIGSCSSFGVLVACGLAVLEVTDVCLATREVGCVLVVDAIELAFGDCLVLETCEPVPSAVEDGDLMVDLTELPLDAGVVNFASCRL